MNRLKKDLCFLKCFFGNHVGIVGMIFFHVVVSACFLICFFSVGMNLYDQVVKLKEDVGESNGCVLCINDAENEKQIINCLDGNGEMGYCFFGEMKEEKENSFTIGMYEDHNLLASDGEVFFLYRFGELMDGVVIWSDVCTENGMNPEDLREESVELTIGGKTKQYRIAAVLDSNADSAFRNFEKEIYIPR